MSAPLVLANRVAETAVNISNTTTVPLAGAVDSRHDTFVGGCGSGATVPYTIVHRTSGQWETGYGVVTAGAPDTITRAVVKTNSAHTTVKLTFAAGTVDIFLDVGFPDLPALDQDDRGISFIDYNAAPDFEHTLFGARGTRAVPTAVQSGDTLGRYGMGGYGATAFSSRAKGALLAVAAENWSDTAQGTDLQLQTTAKTTTTLATKAWLSSEGLFSIGAIYGSMTTAFVQPLQVWAAGTGPLLLARSSADTGGANVTFIKSRGTTAGSSAAVVDGDVVSILNFIAIAGDNATRATAGTFFLQVPTSGVASTTVAGTWNWTTTNLAGSNATRLQLTSEGVLQPGTDNTYALGTSALRFSDFRAMTGTFSSAAPTSIILGSDAVTSGGMKLWNASGSAREGNIYGDATYSIRLDTNSNARPIRIDGSALSVSSPATFLSLVTSAVANAVGFDANSAGVSKAGYRWTTNSSTRWDVVVPSGSTSMSWQAGGSSEVMSLTNTGLLTLSGGISNTGAFTTTGGNTAISGTALTVNNSTGAVAMGFTLGVKGIFTLGESGVRDAQISVDGAAGNIQFQINGTPRAKLFASGGFSVGPTTDPGLGCVSLSGAFTPLWFTNDLVGQGMQVQFGSSGVVNAVGGVYSSGAIFMTFNALQAGQATDSWIQNYASAKSLLLQIDPNGMSLYQANAGKAQAAFATFWGSSLMTVSAAGALTTTSKLSVFPNGTGEKFVVAHDSGGTYVGMESNDALRIITNNAVAATISTAQAWTFAGTVNMAASAQQVWNGQGSLRFNGSGSFQLLDSGGTPYGTWSTAGIRVLSLGVGNSAVATIAVGTLTRKMEVFDTAGSSLGFVPIYATIT